MARKKAARATTRKAKAPAARKAGKPLRKAKKSAKSLKKKVASAVRGRKAGAKKVRAAARKTASRAVKKARSAARAAGRRVKAASGKARRAVRKASGTARRAVTRVAARQVRTAAKRTGPARTAASRAVRKAVVTATAVKAGMKAALSTPPPARKPKHPPTLDRARKTIADTEHHHSDFPSTLDYDPHASAARTGHDELVEKLHHHTSTSPELAAGDIDADWPSAESSGDETPGGDNPTPDQDVVDEIGRALGIQYGDEEELRGGEEISARDHHRWELDPASKDDFDDRD